MKQLLKELWRQDSRGFLEILTLQILSSLMSGIGIVMLIPMLEFFEISAADGLLPGALSAWLGNLPDYGRAGLIVAGYLGLITAKTLLNRALTIRQAAFLEGFTAKLRSQLYESISYALWQQVAAHRQADLIGLFTDQCSRIGNGVSATIRLLASVVSAAIQVAIACWMSLPVTAMVLACGGGMLVLFRPLGRKARGYGESMISASRKLYSEVFHQVNALREIRTYGVEDDHRQRFEEVNREFKQQQVAYAKMAALPGGAYSLGAGVLISLVFLLSVLYLDIGTARVVILVLIFSRLWPMFSGWQSILQTIQANVPALESFRDTQRRFTAAPQEGDAQGRMDFSQGVTLSRVTFRYEPDGAPVLKDVSFSLEPGSITALVGRSGVGKSTLADLLMGFLQPESGEIRVDGQLLTGENVRAWRKNIGYIPQMPLILNASVRENLTRFHPGATDADIRRALTQAAAWEFVEKLPQKLDTVLGDQGIRLSGGERQRIVLARALLGQPRLIILDEATSALDYESEHAIREVLRSLGKRTAILVIAHRLATVMIASRAIVLEDGTITQCGSYDRLLQDPDGYLARMVLAE